MKDVTDLDIEACYGSYIAVRVTPKGGPMAIYVARRPFISMLGGAIVGLPLAARAQQPDSRVYRIAFLAPLPASAFSLFFDELRKQGFVEGQNLVIDRRGFEARYEQFPVLTAELVKAGPDAIICAGDSAIRGMQATTTSIPIVASTDDMIGSGLVRSLAHPGGNTTGLSLLAAELDGKRQEILIDFFPAARHMAVLADTQTADNRRLSQLEDATRARGVTLSICRVERSADIGPAIEAAQAAGAAALNVLASPLLQSNRLAIIVRTAALRLPAVYQWPETAEEGGLLGYGPRYSEFLRQWARQLAKVLRGAKPEDLPVEQPTKFELVVNLKTAKAIGLEFGATLLARADEVIE
jgi:putative ABC transport system substrate-binding protein